jgi:hypothetical protein
LTPPPADLSYNLGGTNHPFEADSVVCVGCHGAFDGGALHDAAEAELDEVKMLCEAQEEFGGDASEKPRP